jgi:hypothetical protein
MATGIAMLARVGWVANLCVATSFNLIQTFIHAHSGHPSSAKKLIPGHNCIE